MNDYELKDIYARIKRLEVKVDMLKKQSKFFNHLGWILLTFVIIAVAGFLILV